MCCEGSLLVKSVCYKYCFPFCACCCEYLLLVPADLMERVHGWYSSLEYTTKRRLWSLVLALSVVVAVIWWIASVFATGTVLTDAITDATKKDPPPPDPNDEVEVIDPETDVKQQELYFPRHPLTLNRVKRVKYKKKNYESFMFFCLFLFLFCDV